MSQLLNSPLIRLGCCAMLTCSMCQAPLSTEFSRQEHWGGLPFPTPEDLPDSGIKPMPLASPALADCSLPLLSPGKLLVWDELILNYFASAPPPPKCFCGAFRLLPLQGYFGISMQQLNECIRGKMSTPAMQAQQINRNCNETGFMPAVPICPSVT